MTGARFIEDELRDAWVAIQGLQRVHDSLLNRSNRDDADRLALAIQSVRLVLNGQAELGSVCGACGCGVRLHGPKHETAECIQMQTLTAMRCLQTTMAGLLEQLKRFQ